MSGYVVDLFAGPGGWDVAAQRLGLDPVGVEMDDAACATRSAAGLRTLQEDVSKVDLGWLGDVAGLIASPPCQTFSMAGKGAGRAALDQVLHGVKRVAAGEPIPYDEYADIRTGLVLEPLRYALELEPEWMCWEQVPTVQPVWDGCAEVLRQDGYSVWTGRLQAEQYGVPQTRKRSVLIASRVRVIDGPPPPTHSQYYPRRPGQLDDGVQKWTSMAEALGWDATAVVRSNYGSGGDPRNRGERQADQPSATVTSKIDRNIVEMGDVRSSHGCVRPVTSPSPSLTSSMDNGNFQWRTGDDPAARPAWPDERPSTTIVGSFRPDVVAAPGYRTTVSRQNAPNSVRVTVQEAAILQSFPPDHPWQGTKTKQYQQIGNAIPPLLALHVLSHATDLHAFTKET